MRLNFSGIGLWATGWAGTFSLSDVVLYDEGGLTGMLHGQYSTGAHSPGQFKPRPIALKGIFSD